MKFFSFFLSLTLASCLLFSCQKDDVTTPDDTPGTPNNPSIPQGISAKIDGSAWSASLNQGLDMGNIIRLMGSTNNGTKFLNLTLPEDVTPGTYNFPGSNPEELQAVYSSLTGTYYAISGKITVAKHNADTRSIEGSFEFVGKSSFSGGTVNVTGGTFNMSYQ